VATAVKILSGGAVQRGLEAAAGAFERESGHQLVLTFATAPAIRRNLQNNKNPPDVVLATIELIEELIHDGRIIAGSQAKIGSVQAGVVVRRGALEPDISTAGALKRAILESQSIVYNEGSSGIFVEKLLQRLGVEAEAKSKTLRFADAEGVMRHIAASQFPNEIGFGQITAILMRADQGVKLVGPLPTEIANVTTYAAGVSVMSQDSSLARRFVDFLSAPEARALFKTNGVE
jgi:molybdate transport system substrate-binding protein